MKKTLLLAATMILATNISFALNTAFDTTASATEVNIKPAAAANTSAKEIATMQEQKYNTALSNLEDAQVGLRQELAEANQKLAQAKSEKDSAYENYRNIKREVRTLNKKIKNIETTKKYINKNLENK